MKGRNKMTTARKKAEKKSVKKTEKVDIFSLYKQEKIVTLKDDAGREVKILMVKPTQGERQKLLEQYVDILATVRDQYINKDKKTQYYTKTIQNLTKEQIIEGVMNYQRAQRGEMLDLYPLPDDLTDKQREEKQEEIMADWEKNRAKDLEKMSLDQLRKELAHITIEGLSLIESGRRFDFISLQMMCLNPETKEHIFDTVEAVESVRDKRIIETLLGELNEFRAAENMKDVRQSAEDPDFLTAGESLKS
jgi:hypothetical protein